MNQQRENQYILGHHNSELERLIQQSRFYGDLTEQVFRNAGLAPGMSVLDVGCGTGDVSFLAASFVGSSGSVIGVDQSEEALAVARKRADDAGLRNVTFRQSNLEQLSLNVKVDALVGRLVLLYMKDAAQSIRQWAGLVHRGGIVAFHEMVMTGMRSIPVASIYEDAGKRVVETFRRAGNDVEMGLKLYPTFIAAGLPGPQMIMGGRIEGGPESQAYDVLTGIVRTLLPAMERFGIWTAAEVEVDSLASRMRDEVVRGGGVVQSPTFVGAWTQIP